MSASFYFSSALCFLLQREQVEAYVPKYLVYSLLWCMAGDGKMKIREKIGDYIQKVTTIPLPPHSSMPIIDYEVGPVLITILVLTF